MSQTQEETVFVTKWALTQGIIEMRIKKNPGNGMIVTRPLVESADNGYVFDTYLHGEGKEWHRTWEGAVAQAKAMQQKKIASVKKQLAKLERLSFDA